MSRTKKRILFVGLHRPSRSPSQRYRIEQFLPYLKESNIEYDYSYVINEKRDKIFYQPGKILGKIWIVIFSTIKRLFEALFVAHKYDYIFVQREAYMLGTPFFEKMYAQKSKLIFDFDDSIWLLDVSQANKKFAFLKNPNKTAEIIQAAYLIVAGNKYLADYARNFNENVVVIPTCIDTNEYNRQKEYTEKTNEKVCIGWSGSQTTIEHFRAFEPVLMKLKARYKEKIYFKVIGDGSYENKQLSIKGQEWKRATEIRALEEIDIGIMPLPHDKWTEGKCGLKGLVYMSMKIPAILENVGVNKEIVIDKKNAFLAIDEQEWLEKLSILIEDFELRKAMGEQGRETVLKKYSIHSQKEAFLKCFN